MKRTIALVLCGGEGTRLRPLTFYFQKTMLPIGINQKPLLE
ncbi:MAG: nucleotidyltransferase family protein, partial [Thermoprotei archaeon]